MARLPRICPPGIPVHIIQRGNNRQVCFAADEDFAAYANWLNESSVIHRVAIHAWVFQGIWGQSKNSPRSGLIWEITLTLLAEEAETDEI